MDSGWYALCVCVCVCVEIMKVSALKCKIVVSNVNTARLGVDREAAGLCIAGLRMDVQAALKVTSQERAIQQGAVKQQAPPTDVELQGPFVYTLHREQADPDDPTQLSSAAASMVCGVCMQPTPFLCVHFLTCHGLCIIVVIIVCLCSQLIKFCVPHFPHHSFAFIEFVVRAPAPLLRAMRALYQGSLEHGVAQGELVILSTEGPGAQSGIARGVIHRMTDVLVEVACTKAIAPRWLHSNASWRIDRDAIASTFVRMRANVLALVKGGERHQRRLRDLVVRMTGPAAPLLVGGLVRMIAWCGAW